MNHSAIPLAQSVTRLCSDKGIRQVIICPGSRSAPLTIGFTGDSRFNTYSIVDERCAAFFALGIAQQIHRPAAVVCTSGSAVLNCYPAVAEAFYADIPLVIISADRPPHLVDIGDGQTIRQENVFANHILYSANLKNKPEDDLRELNQAFNTAITENGPVHINVPFDEPLYHTTSKLLTSPKSIEVKKPVPPKEDLSPFALPWNKARRKLVIAGQMPPGSVHKKYLNALGQDESILVFTETTSNLHHPNFIGNIDQLIAPLDKTGFEELRPDILLTMGGMVVSKKVKAFLRGYQPKHHWHIGEKTANDTYFCLENHFKTTPDSFFADFLPLTAPVKSDYQKNWLKQRTLRKSRHRTHLGQIPFSDLKAFGHTLHSLPKKSALQLGNSATVRYSQLFDLPPGMPVYSNRGVSGIDGSVSTAVGAAVVSPLRTTLITGDLGFFYDSNALWNNYIPNNFRIVVINNRGGGIFRILPGHKNSENFDTYFETVHDLTAQHLCRMYGIEYRTANDESELETQLRDFYGKSHAPRLLEIFTPRKVNDEVLLGYFEALTPPSTAP